MTNQTINSIKATQGRIERQLSINMLKTDMTRNVVISVVSLILSIIGLIKLTNYQVPGNPSPILSGIAIFSVRNPFSAFGIILIILVTYIQITLYRMGIVSILHIKSIRVVQYLPKWVLALSIMLLSFITSLLTIWIFIS